MKKILFNGEYYASQKEPSGIARHSFELLRELDKIVKPGEVTILAPKCSVDETEFSNIRFKKVGYNAEKGNKFENRIFKAFWKYMIFPLYCKLGGFLSVNMGLAWKYYQFDVMSVYDCTHDILPELITPEAKPWYENLTKMQRRYLPKAKCVLTDSYDARKDISNVYNVPIEKIKVIYCGWQHLIREKEDESIIERLSLRDREFFFSLGSRFPHKNIKWVNAAANKNPHYTFVVTGSKQGRKDTSYEGEPPENMVFTGYLSDAEVKALMMHCKAFIQPSLYEGFGIPPLEAMSVGADCIVSDRGSLPEVYKNSVWYIDPEDYENIDLDEIISKPKESNDKILNEFSWAKSAEKLWIVLKEVAGK